MTTVTANLKCIRCAYQLRGAQALGRCPECGMAVTASLASSVDPRMREMAALEHPKRIAFALAAAGIAPLLCVALQVGAPMLAMTDSLTNRASAFPQSVRLWAWIACAAALLFALSAQYILWSAQESAFRSEMGRWRFWMVLGAWLWMLALVTAVLMMLNPQLLADVFSDAVCKAIRNALPIAGTALQLPGMAMMLSGLSAMLAITGRRSRTFREAGSARQSVKLLNQNVSLLVVLCIASPILRTRLGWDVLSIVSDTAVAALAGLLLFGAAYLATNSYWIARALLLPPLPIEEAISQD